MLLRRREQVYGMTRPSRHDLKGAALSRGDLTDAEWRILNPLLPARGERGRNACRSSPRIVRLVGPRDSPSVFVSREPRTKAIGPPFNLEAHSSASLRRRNVSLTYFRFRLTWTRQELDLSFVKVAKPWRSACIEPSNCREMGRMMA